MSNITCIDCAGYQFCKDFLGRTEFYAENACDNVEEICKNYKDKSHFVYLPCKAGDKCYSIWQGFNKEPQVKEDTIYRIVDIDNKVLYETYWVYGKVGEEIFLTKEEAEAKLKENKK